MTTLKKLKILFIASAFLFLFGALDAQDMKYKTLSYENAFQNVSNQKEKDIKLFYNKSFIIGNCNSDRKISDDKIIRIYDQGVNLGLGFNQSIICTIKKAGNGIYNLYFKSLDSKYTNIRYADQSSVVATITIIDNNRIVLDYYGIKIKGNKKTQFPLLYGFSGGLDSGLKKACLVTIDN